MKITSEDVKAVQQRIDVTYEEAERFLIKAKGDIDLAVYMINRKRDSSSQKFFDEAQRIFKELLTYYIKVDKKNKVFLNIPLVLILLFFVLVDLDTKIWVLVVSIGMILISESQVSIFKEEKKDDKDIIIVDEEPSNEEKKDDSTEAEVEVTASEDVPVENVAVTVNDESSQVNISSGDDDDDDDYYEITIEK